MLSGLDVILRAFVLNLHGNTSTDAISKRQIADPVVLPELRDVTERRKLTLEYVC